MDNKLEAWLREKGELYQRIGQQDYRDRMVEAADEITRLNAENERLKAYAREASIALSHLSGGGSEVFGKIGEEYYAEPKLAVERAEHKAATIERLVGARFNALVDEMREGLEQAAGWFEEYATQHYAKARTAPDGREQHGREIKGKVNADRAKELRALITKASRDSGHG